MERKENVCVEKTLGTEKIMEESAGAVGRNERPDNVSTVPEKFKDVNALARAYEALQAEFTRRSQRLRELEKTVENLDVNGGLRGGSGAEKLRKNALARKAQSRVFDEFVADMGRGKAQPVQAGEEKTAAEPTDKTDKPLQSEEQVCSTQTTDESYVPEREETQGLDGTANGLKGESAEMERAVAAKDIAVEKNLAEGIPSAQESVEKESSAQTLYEQVCQNEKVRLRIIGEYLSSVGKTAAPLTAGGVGALTTPPKKTVSIGDAGNRALLYFKNAIKEA